jgi:predicted nuclease of predicted toxin-antitoxin system
LIFLFDENMPPRVAAALQALGTCEARHVVDHLPRGTPDEQVFEFAAARGWVLVTQDIRIRRNPHQRAALLQAGIGAFILTGRGGRSVEQMMIFLLERFPHILEAAAATRPPFIWGVPDRGRLDRLG